MKEFNKTYFDIISESSIKFNELKPISKNVPSLEEVKVALLKLYKFSTWEDFINYQQVGQCDRIAKTVCKLFPKIKMVSAIINFSEVAKIKINDGGEYNAVHYFNKIGKDFVDFGKGTNRYNEVYILTGIDDLYDVNFSNEAIKNIKDVRPENPKLIGTILR